MKDRYLKIYNTINWPIIFFAIFLVVFLFDINVRIALVLYAFIVCLDIVAVLIQKNTKQFIINIFAVVILFGLMLFFK
ncbi:hypothetical protein [Peribacillus sp. NPDC096448]|uniref:hypothetical protein n=1 Tax=Peribacillus sp. NPDC096448 TaxID=3364395 RepID=UPI00380B8FD6